MSSKKKAAAKVARPPKEADSDTKLLAEAGEADLQSSLEITCAALTFLGPEKKDAVPPVAAKSAAPAATAPAPVAVAAKPSAPVAKSPAVAKTNPDAKPAAAEAKPAAAEAKPAAVEAKPAASAVPKPAAPVKPAAAVTPVTVAAPTAVPAPAAADQDDKPLTEEERRKKRMERFGAVAQSPSNDAAQKLAARQKRFGNMTLDNRPNKRQSGEVNTTEIEEKKALSARLGLPLKGTKLASDIESMGKNITEADEKIKQRAARFGIPATASATVAANPEEEDKKRRRQERFAKQ